MSGREADKVTAVILFCLKANTITHPASRKYKLDEKKMTTICPHCRQKYEIDRNLSGRQVQCTSCGSCFVVKPENFGNDNQCEEMIVNENPSGWTFCLEYFFGILLLAVSIYGLFFSDFSKEINEILHYVFSTIAFASLWLVAETLFLQLTTHYVLTNRRVIYKRGWLVKRQTEVMIQDIRGVETQANIFERIVGAGTIVIGTAATAKAEIRMRGIKNPMSFVSQVNNIRRT